MGVGLWQWNALFRDMVWWKATVDSLVATGVKEWLIKILDGTNLYNGDYLKPAVSYAKDNGLTVWAWGYEYPSEDDAAALGGRARALGADGVVIDAEKEWAHAAYVPAQFVRAVKDAFQGPVWLSTYSAPSLHPEFPYLSFMNECDGGMPQVYQTPQDVWAARAQKEWLEFNKPIILTGLADQYLGTQKDTETFLKWCTENKVKANLWCIDHMTVGMNAVVERYAGGLT